MAFTPQRELWIQISSPCYLLESASVEQASGQQECPSCKLLVPCWMEPQGGGPVGFGSTTSLSRRPCNSQTTGTTEKPVHWNGLSMSAHIWDQSCKLAVWKFCRCGRDCVSCTLRVVGLSVNICLKGECMQCLIILQELVSLKRNSLTTAHAVTHTLYRPTSLLREGNTVFCTHLNLKIR